ncbi:hypothetical protein OKW76_04665 [Sphingomonas sp. S1-29]|uniref:hypothetical protein n=1 Tax=Sphingomonas sp. S1-29 TaxID=2991074 RepID=UPI00223EED46|nr:hypothetical protein [Sphingomonas sp. S1-29]UZK70343.1 hypothetical protein OKW76_04665 [Sphingomonas sp. S1-29]
MLAVRELGHAAAAKPIAEFDLGELQVEVRTTQDSVFVVVVREGRGGVALRAAYVVRLRMQGARCRRARMRGSASPARSAAI